MKNIVKQDTKDLTVKLKKDSGITLVALTITIIVLIIIATISIREGTQIIKEAKVQTFETNMFAIKAKAKTYVEEVEAATWGISNDTEREEKRNIFFTGNIDANGYGMKKCELGDININTNQLLNSINLDNCEMYEITSATLDKMGLNEMSEDLSEDAKYIVIYNKDNFNEMDIIYTEGVIYQKETYFTLSSLQKAHDGVEE